MKEEIDDQNEKSEKNENTPSKKQKNVGYRIDRQSPQETNQDINEDASLVAKAPVDFSESFMEKLRAAFIEQEWRIKREQNILTISSLALTPPKQIFIRNTKKGMIFSGNALSEKEIVMAANAYQAACLDEGEKVIFEVDARNENAAIAFMTKLKNEGFDITKISAVNCKGMDLEGKSMKDYTKEILAKIDSSNKSTPKTTPKPKLPGTI